MSERGELAGISLRLFQWFTTGLPPLKLQI
jgi:hypothetical protein